MICNWGMQITRGIFLLSRESRIWNSKQSSAMLPNCKHTEPIPVSLFSDPLSYIIVYKNKTQITKQVFVSIETIGLYDNSLCVKIVHALFTISNYVSNFGPGSSVGIAGWSRWERDFPSVQTGPGAHPASCKMGTGSFPGVKCGRGVLLTTHPLLVPRSWKSRAIPLRNLWATPDL